MLVDKIPWTLWLLLAVVLFVASAINKPRKPVDILPKVQAVDEPRTVDCQVPVVGHVYNYLTQGPAYLVGLW
jgi:hypothetical protein